VCNHYSVIERLLLVTADSWKPQKKESVMKRCVLIGSGIILSIFIFLAACASAASISGTVSYNGSQSGSIVVAAFTYPLTCSGPYDADPNPYSLVELETLGNYTIPNLPDGTYYLVSVIFTDGLEGDLQATDPWAMYDGCDNITPIVLTGGVGATGKNMLLVDGSVDAPNPFYSTYYIIAHSAHDYWGYSMEIYVDDSSHNATAVSVTGPGISGGTASLEYNSSEGRWDSSNTGKLAFTESPMTPPLTYFIDITDSSGTTQHEAVIQGYVEVFASNLSPGGNQVVTENPVFNWTGVEGDYTYEIRLDSSNWHKNNLTETSIAYDGSPLIPGTNYEWHVNVTDQYNNVSYAFANFVYQPSQQVPPDVTTVISSDVTAKSATLWGLIGPNNDSTTYYFEYGPTNSYGSISPEVSGLTDNSTELVSVVISSLSPGTIYHYRVVAYNTGGISYGDDLTFTTRSGVLVPIFLLLE